MCCMDQGQELTPENIPAVSAYRKHAFVPEETNTKADAQETSGGECCGRDRFPAVVVWLAYWCKIDP